jgi:glycosyltransferase involved in cell wall biosynthesis
MKLLWVTPFNTRSAIGVYSREVCHELADRGHEVLIMREESDAEAYIPALQTSLPILGPDEAIPTDLDLALINYGNHAPYHAGALRIATDQPAVAIFHDAEMRDFSWGMRNRHNLLVPDLLKEGRPQDLATDAGDLVDPAARPVLQALSSMACGAIVHGPHYQATVESACAGPVEVFPLCFPPTMQIKARKADTTCRRVTIFGIINPHKQPERLMKAVSLLKDRFGPIEIHLAGFIEDAYRRLLTDRARLLGISPPIFHGYLSDSRLADVLNASDVICCLRYPVTEGGSASVITALYQERPLIVSNIASYSMVPDALVHKVSYGEDPEDLAMALQSVFRDFTKAEAVAAEARAWAATTYCSKTYVNHLEAFMDRVIEALPVQRAYRQLAKFATTPQGEMMPSAMFRIAYATDALFGPG